MIVVVLALVEFLSSKLHEKCEQLICQYLTLLRPRIGIIILVPYFFSPSIGSRRDGCDGSAYSTCEDLYLIRLDVEPASSPENDLVTADATKWQVIFGSTRNI